jgi:predicted glycosyltransferase
MLVKRGHTLLVLSRGGGITEELLSKYNIPHRTYGEGSNTLYGKLLRLPSQLTKCFTFISKFHPDIIVGSGILEAHVSAILRKPCVIFEDTEVTPWLERVQWQLTASMIISPSCLMKDLGKKQIRIEGYKELAYLHPNRFKPDPSIFEELGIDRSQKYVVVRFNAFAAIHDVGVHGFSLEDKYILVKALEKHTLVFISAEGGLAENLRAYRLPTAPHRIHHVLYYAQMIVADSGTMAVESAVLGTPGIVCESTSEQTGNIVEIEQKYGLLYVVLEPKKAIGKALELIQKPNLKEDCAKKRQQLLADKIDVAEFMTEFIENYHESIRQFEDSNNSVIVLRKTKTKVVTSSSHK